MHIHTYTHIYICIHTYTAEKSQSANNNTNKIKTKKKVQALMVAKPTLLSEAHGYIGMVKPLMKEFKIILTKLFCHS